MLGSAFVLVLSYQNCSKGLGGSDTDQSSLQSTTFGVPTEHKVFANDAGFVVLLPGGKTYFWGGEESSAVWVPAPFSGELETTSRVFATNSSYLIVKQDLKNVFSWGETFKGGNCSKLLVAKTVSAVHASLQGFVIEESDGALNVCAVDYLRISNIPSAEKLMDFVTMGWGRYLLVYPSKILLYDKNQFVVVSREYKKFEKRLGDTPDDALFFISDKNGKEMLYTVNQEGNLLGKELASDFQMLQFEMGEVLVEDKISKQVFHLVLNIDKSKATANEVIGFQQVKLSYEGMKDDEGLDYSNVLRMSQGSIYFQNQRNGGLVHYFSGMGIEYPRLNGGEAFCAGITRLFLLNANNLVCSYESGQNYFFEDENSQQRLLPEIRAKNIPIDRNLRMPFVGNVIRFKDQSLFFQPEEWQSNENLLENAEAVYAGGSSSIVYIDKNGRFHSYRDLNEVEIPGEIHTKLNLQFPYENLESAEFKVESLLRNAGNYQK